MDGATAWSGAIGEVNGIGAAAADDNPLVVRSGDANMARDDDARTALEAWCVGAVVAPGLRA